ncbi:MAG: type II secretion system GspH family protein [Lentisphaeraceae bacterium]|nr:type II secretion system GspH family protein [Lentisphaeraceae bacterium]
MSRNKFTLIELLVVVAIIGILCTLLMPSLGRARAAAKRAVCMSNQKQIGIAFMSYTGSNNGQLPSPLSGSYTWDDLLAPYDGRSIPSNWNFQGNNSTGSWGGTFEYEHWQSQLTLYQCPIDPTDDGTRVNRSFAVNSGYPGNWWGSRGPIMSGWWTENGSISEPWSMNIGNINKPASAILMGEVTFDANTQSLIGHNSSNAKGNWKGVLDINPIKHGRQLSLNYLFNDMHVSFLSIHALNGDSGKYLWGGETDLRGTLLDCRD